MTVTASDESNPKLNVRNFPDRVAVLRGGDSAEREISMKSGKAVEGALQEFPCDVIPLDTSVELAQRLLEKNVDVVFIALHGPRGEDGTVQGLLDWIGIPYTGPGVTASALCMDKIHSRRIFDSMSVPAPDWYTVSKGETTIVKEVFERSVVKPRHEGSSLGMSIVERTEIEPAVEKAMQYSDEILVEEYISGYETTVGVFGSEDTNILPPVGIRPSHEFFDYETKYTKGLTEYDVPADLEQETIQKLRDLTKKIVSETDTKSLCRVDYIVGEDAEPYVLEINTIPGLTETSLLPKAAAEAGYTFEKLVGELVMEALGDKTWQPE